MKMIAVAGWCGLLLSACDDNAPLRSDASNSEVHPQVEAGSASDSPVAAPNLHFLLIAAVLEVERSLIARCPCLTADGHYESEVECVRAVSLGRDWVDCANDMDLSGLDDAESRASLRCNIEEISERTECLMASSCNADAVAECMSKTLGCSMLPLNLLSRVTVECSIAFSH
jgi:hypothetical protein